MASKIILKKSSVTGRVPVTDDLDYGELALNYTDGKLYYKTSTNVIDAFSVTPANVPIYIGDTAPSTPVAGELWWNSAEGSLKIYYYDGIKSQWVDAVSSPILTTGNSETVESPFARTDLSVSSSSLANNASENLTLAAYKSYVLMSVSTSAAAWVRLYSDPTSRTSDQARNIGTDPIAGTGVIAEIITTGNMQQKITPFIFGGNLESPPTDNIYLRVTNLSGSSASINVTLKLTRLEI